MLRRLFSGPLRFHLHLPLQTPTSHLLRPISHPSLSSFNHTRDLHYLTLRLFSTSGRDGSDGTGGIWKDSEDADELKASLFVDDALGSDPADNVNRARVSDAWGDESTDETKVNLFADTEQEGGTGMNEPEPWSFGDAAEEGGGLFGDAVEEGGDLFESLEEGKVGLDGFSGDLVEDGRKKVELNEAELDKKEKELREILKGLDF